MTKTVAGLFRTFDEAQAAVNGLLNGGFSHDAIDLLANNEGERFAAGLPESKSSVAPVTGTDFAEGTLTGAGEGAVIGGIAGLAVGLITLMIPGVGPVLAMGPLVAGLVGAELGAIGGGVVGALTEIGLTGPEANHYADGIRNGGALVMVRASSPAETRLAADILDRNNPVDLSWGSWTSFGTSATYTNPADSAAMPDDPDLYADEDTLADEHASQGSGIHEYAARI